MGEIYLQTVKAAEEQKGDDNTIESVVSILKRRVEQTLDRVEQLKSTKKPVSQDRHQNAAINEHRTTSQQRKSATSLTEREILILKRSSLIASGLFMPWSDKDAMDLN